VFNEGSMDLCAGCVDSVHNAVSPVHVFSR
jgi:hypothetical protein